MPLADEEDYIHDNLGQLPAHNAIGKMWRVQGGPWYNLPTLTFNPHQ